MVCTMPWRETGRKRRGRERWREGGGERKEGKRDNMNWLGKCEQEFLERSYVYKGELCRGCNVTGPDLMTI